MSAVPPVSFQAATRRFGDRAAVEGLSFDVRPGRVVGLLGRNGAGKTTSLRMLLGLTAPTSGTATIFGRPYAHLADAACRVGVSMEGVGALPGVSGRRDLEITAKALGLPVGRAGEVLEQVGLADPKVADRPVARYSTGMRQRHGLACALLAEPELLVLDEPANGLDPDGIRWMRGFLRGLADAGHTILLSSHLLAEVEQVVDDVVIIQRTLRYSGPLRDLTDGGAHSLEDRFFQLVDGDAPPAGGATVRSGAQTGTDQHA
ncbi:ABC transporter ATP-binding protein [Polymorphospora rubra]|uniref:ABC transporter ATP-binding protein n=1 Tax=Polymorphospora rubra TaxID=338584 RepID=UPI003411C284